MRQDIYGENKGAVFLILILVILISVSVALALSLRENFVEESLKTDRTINTLLVLENNRQVLFSGVLMYNPVSKRGALINILGNTAGIYKSINRMDGIAAVYTECGIDDYISEIGSLVGQNIPFYITFNMEEFGEMTDMLGGLKLFIPSPVDLKLDDGERFLLPSGVVNLDGDKIKTYLSYTKADESEDDKTERVQDAAVAFLSALARNSRLISDKDAFDSLGKRMHCNLSGKNYHRLLAELSNVDSDHINPQVITGSRRNVDGKVLLFPLYEGQFIKDVFKQTLNSLINFEYTNASRIYVLEIQNGTTVQGLARNTSALFKSAGYDVLNTINADRNDYENTVIINHIGNAEIAKNLGDFIHCKNIVEESVLPESEGKDSTSNVDFTVIVGRDFDGRYVRNTGVK